MTVAVGQKFSQGPAESASVPRHRAADDGDARAFGHLVHGNGSHETRTAPTRSGEAKPGQDMAGRNHDRAGAGSAESTMGRHASGRTRHPGGAGSADPSTDGRIQDEHHPEETGTGDAQPLRDRLPLLATLNGLGHHAAGPAAKPDRKQDGMIRTGDAVSGAVDGNPSASARAGGRTGTHPPDDAGRQATLGGSSMAAVAETITSGMKSERSPRVPAVVAPTARSQGRQAENGAQSSEVPGRPSASRSAADRLTGTSSTMPMQIDPANGFQDDPTQDGHESADDNRVGSARSGRRASERDESAQESDRTSRNSAERRTSGSVNVVADRSFPAPAAHPLSRTTAGVIDALAAVGNQVPASALSQHPQAATVAHPAHVLRIELHPAELGAVTASLRMSGEQLSIELNPETAEAYRHLTRDSDTIVKSLRKLGLDVDSVTVMQPSMAAQPAVRADTGNQSSLMPGRDAGQFQPGMSGGSGDGSGGHHPGRNRSHDGQSLDRPPPAYRERAQGSLFI